MNHIADSVASSIKTPADAEAYKTFQKAAMAAIVGNHLIHAPSDGKTITYRDTPFDADHAPHVIYADMQHLRDKDQLMPLHQLRSIPKVNNPNIAAGFEETTLTASAMNNATTSANEFKFNRPRNIPQPSGENSSKENVLSPGATNLSQLLGNTQNALKNSLIKNIFERNLFNEPPETPQQQANFVKMRAGVKNDLTKKFNKQLYMIKNELNMVKQNPDAAKLYAFDNFRRGGQWDFKNHPEAGWPSGPYQAVLFDNKVVGSAYFANAAFGYAARVLNYSPQKTMVIAEAYANLTTLGKDIRYDTESIISGMALHDFGDPWHFGVPYLKTYGNQSDYIFPLKQYLQDRDD